MLLTALRLVDHCALSVGLTVLVIGCGALLVVERGALLEQLLLHNGDGELAALLALHLPRQPGLISLSLLAFGLIVLGVAVFHPLRVAADHALLPAGAAAVVLTQNLQTVHHNYAETVKSHQVCELKFYLKRSYYFTTSSVFSFVYTHFDLHIFMAQSLSNNLDS